MKKTVIDIQGVHKLYRLGERGNSFSTFRDLFSPKEYTVEDTDESAYVHALNNISFEVKENDILGIIGPNGSGKSALLKLISQITPPSKGKLIVDGRVGSLLEVGTGFHPELTGRENIFLNGAILGMKRKEIEEKFDDIVAFADVEKFIDTPIKFFSSGMHVRLAFAVAAHIEPDIFLIDEVLAVGDIAFQKRCLEKLNEVQQQGKTILFVSHNMGAISALCTRVCVLNKGELVFNGSTHEGIQSYLRHITASETTEWEGQAGDDQIRLLKTWVKPLDDDRLEGQLHTGTRLQVGIEIDVLKPTTGLVLGFTLLSESGAPLSHVRYDDDLPPPADTIEPGKKTYTFTIPENTLAQGMYYVHFDVGIHLLKQIIREEGSLAFRLNFIEGLGQRFNLVDHRGQHSLFRPLWSDLKKDE